uniref:RNase H type-1 domain-containing protein n=1 Tax=Chenopodium quinoa TaxID=63459 RepID=A0A803N6C4_CHEQI
MEKWALHLCRYDIQYESRTAIKSQALTDFVADFSPTLEEEAQKEVLALQEPKAGQKWILHTDGAANIRGVGLGVVLTSPHGDKIAQAIRCNFKATNNEAEYEALITGLTVARDMKIQHLEVISDSLLMVNQINGEYAAKDTRMIAYLEVTKKLIKEFKIDQVPRNLNTEADALANLGSNINPEEFGAIPLVHVLSPAIEKDSTMNVCEVQIGSTGKEGDSKATPLKEYLLDKTVPTGKVAAQAFALKTSKYCLISNVLFKKSAAVEVPTASYGLMTEERNQAELIHNLDTVEELREDAKMRMAAYQQEVARSFNKNVRARVFKLGDWVLIKVYENTREVNAGKLAPNWEGPYEIIKVVGNGAYRLRDMEGKEVQRSWNAAHLNLYHF